MKLPLSLALITLVAIPVCAQEAIPNRLIDYDKFKEIVIQSSAERESRRLTEAQFMAMMKEQGIVLLDARSESRYNLRHIKGAINLPFTEFTEESLAAVIPRKDTKVLIYCNNNFEGSQTAFAAKAPAASLNLSTYTSLKAYGYRNVYELGPLLYVSTTKILFEGKEVGNKDSKAGRLNPL
ncbi:rhodanese-like domain-containing protein [Trichocoleus sp. FACHB-591]|uniref:rhodanese-like domain-containing protein n=1 Tax=Trichocoleus sp. FACHB-591 TaxID=2692872 RepID=UPI00168845F5|nr:rhodanese-like domain-containing protein [Trichocoleus sp. FACHB-591]MBD2094059.1 rhodanese-like domain-containing protein [Trichocoleus sp. FACHB-591]